MQRRSAIDISPQATDQAASNTNSTVGLPEPNSPLPPGHLDAAVHGLGTARDLKTAYAWIALIAEVRSEDAVRALLRIYRETPWRETKKFILSEMGQFTSLRAFQHLTRVASDNSDLPLAEQAIHALADIPSPAAQQFLLNLLDRHDSPLAGAALRALAKKGWIMDVDQLVTLLEKLPKTDRLLESLIVAIGQLGSSAQSGLVEEYLQPHFIAHRRELFIAALIALAKIGGRGSRDKLNALHLEGDVSLGELRAMSAQAITLRLEKGLPDAILLLRDGGDENLRAGLSLLREIPPAKAWQEYLTLGELLPPLEEGWLRIRTFHPERTADDLAFIAANAAHLPSSALALFCSRLIAARKDVSSRPSRKPKSPDIMQVFVDIGKTDLLAQVSSPEITEFLCGLLNTATSRGDHAGQANLIGCLTTQGLTHANGHPERHRIHQQLLMLFQQAPAPATRERALRALAELGENASELLPAVKSALKDGRIGQATAVYYCQTAPCPAAVPFLLKLLRQTSPQAHQAGKENSRDAGAGAGTTAAGGQGTDGIPAILEALSRLCKPGELSENSSDMRQDPTNRKSMLAMLALLANQKINGFEDLILDRLAGESVIELLPAVAAARLNQNDSIREKLLFLSQSPEPAIRVRAIDSLARNQTYKSHKALIQNFEHNPKADPALMHQAFSSITPEAAADYRALQAALKRILSKSAFTAAEPAKSSGEELIETLSLHADLGSPVGVEGADGSHDLDIGLALQIPGYESYSISMKSVLRSAELTLIRKDVFDHRVDKSVAIVQYVKAIDLLLHEKIGPHLHQATNDALLARMQSTLYVLGLDEQRLQSVVLLEELQLAGAFTESEFPAAKLRALCGELMSGKFFQNYNRSIDGLRAWALLLLLFGRNFQSGQGTRVQACFPLKTTNAARITTLAARLNDLQSTRNSAAHRGTYFDAGEIHLFREKAFAVLGELREIL